MNPDFAKYLSDLPAPAIKLWLQILAQKSKAGVYVVLYDQLTQANDISTVKLKRWFKPRAAQKLGLLEITEVTELGIAFKLFAKTVTVPVKGAVLKKSHIAAKTQIAVNAEQVMLQTAASNQLIPISPSQELSVAERGPAYETQPACTSELLPHNYKVTHHLLRALIFDYCEFYKNIQTTRAMLAGQHIEKPLNPRITYMDRKGLTDLALHFKQIGSKSENGIRRAFQAIYQCWEQMPQNYQNYFTPSQMLRNINGIVLEMQKITGKYKQPSQNQTKKDANTTEKINNAESKDYSHLARN